MKITIVREKQPHHPLLGRNVNHDSRSWSYALQPHDTPIRSVRHAAYIGIMDQGDVGSCTGNASVACAYRAPFYAPDAPAWQYEPTESGALTWYSQNTAGDDYAGTYYYPTGYGVDTGSDGLTSSKVAMQAGIITGYQMAGDLASSLEALQDRPGITGLPWYNSMFDAPASGLLTVDTSSGLAGGHELCVDEVVAVDSPGNGTGRLLVGGPNSWGTSWGARGRWYLPANDWWALRQQQGDVYFWTAKSQPAPLPTRDSEQTFDDNDLALWVETTPFRHDRHTAPLIVHAAHSLETWAALKGLV
jgi:hypothetical protein